MSGFLVEGRTRATEAVRIHDITREVVKAVRESGVRNGICCVSSPLTTCAVRVNEFEAGFFEDFELLLTRLVPSGRRHTREAAALRAQGLPSQGLDNRARRVSMLLGPAGESIPVSDRELCLGRWQRVLFLDFEGGHEDEEGWHAQVVGS